MSECERLYDCVVSYHLISGQVLNETFRKDVPSEVWESIKQEFVSYDSSIELEPTEAFANVLLPKSNVSYITMKVLSST